MPEKIEEAKRKVEEALDDKEKVMEQLDAISQDLQNSREKWEEMKKEFEGLDATVGDVTLFPKNVYWVISRLYKSFLFQLFHHLPIIFKKFLVLKNQ